MWSFITRYWRGEIRFVKSFCLIFMPVIVLLATVDSVLGYEAHIQRVISNDLVQLFHLLFFPVLVWLVTGAWRSARRVLNSEGPRSATVQRWSNRFAVFMAASWVVVGVMATASLIFPIRAGESVGTIAFATAFGLGITALAALGCWSIIPVVGNLIATLVVTAQED
jgi:hypothetical protein